MLKHSFSETATKLVFFWSVILIVICEYFCLKFSFSEEKQKFGAIFLENFDYNIALISIKY